MARKRRRRLDGTAKLVIAVLVLVAAVLLIGIVQAKIKYDALRRHIVYSDARDAQLSAEGAIWWKERQIREGEDPLDFLMRYDLARGEVSEFLLTQEQRSQGQMLSSDVPGGVYVLEEYDMWQFNPRDQDFGRYQFFVPDDLAAGPIFEVELGPEGRARGIFGDYLYYERDGRAYRATASGEEQRYGETEGFVSAVSPDGKLLLDNSYFDLQEKFPERETWIDWADFSIAMPDGRVELLAFPEGHREQWIAWESEESLIAILTNMEDEETLCRYTLSTKAWEPILDNQGRSIDISDIEEFTLSPDGGYIAFCEPLSEYDSYGTAHHSKQNFVILSLQTGERYAFHTLNQTNETDYRSTNTSLHWSP